MPRRLDRIVTILRKTDTASSSGEPIPVWSPIVRRRSASMWPIKGDEKFANPEKVATSQTEIRIRYSSDVSDLTPLDRIIYPALVVDEDPEDAPDRLVHEIISVEEIGRREGLKIITQRRPDIEIITVPTDGPSLDFSNPDNSMYVSVI